MFADRVWAAVRERFCDEVLAHDKHLIAVPNLSQADYFDTYYMFIKEKAVRLVWNIESILENLNK